MGRWAVHSVAWNCIRLYTYPLIFVGQSATIGLTVLIAANRYVAVCKPYSASTYCSLPLTRKAVAAVFLAAVLYNIPHFLETEMKIIPPPINSSDGMNSAHFSLNKNRSNLGEQSCANAETYPNPNLDYHENVMISSVSRRPFSTEFYKK